MEQAQPLANKHGREKGDACNISARPIQALDITGLHRVITGGENNRNRLGCRLRGKNGITASRSNDRRHFVTDKIIR